MMFQYLFLGITLPIWLLQAIYVKFKAIRLPQAIATNSHRHEKGISLAVLGDSVAAGVGVPHLDNALAGNIRDELSIHINLPINVNVLAKTGDKLSHLNGKIASNSYVSCLSADYVVVSIGVNEVTSLTSSKRWLAQLTIFCDYFRNNLDTGQVRKIIIIGIPPMEQFPLIPFPLSYLFGQRAKQLNLVTQQVIKNYHNIAFLPISVEPDQSLFAEDGFHPSQTGCQLLAKELSALLISK